ncbi:MAG TPA: undecaprenyl-diphosphate phosphatase [Ignavibacteria bacterium]|nr:undecaprenyl-diphosphate phosphatase [Ignavibacteria bacterium]HMQ98009.1 undecaprenyl-diphosphate phosphatase [Ignavibacteria bacterium]
MTEILKAILLGVVQGLTEFLPVSSTAHLRIIPSFFGWGDIGASYTAVIQVGTMIAIILYFRNDLMNMTKAMLLSLKTKDFNSKDTRLLLMIIIGTIPIVIAGFLLKDLIRHQFRNMYIVAASLIFFSIILMIADRITKKKVDLNSITYKDGIIIGIFQAMALIPGASRSGSTISGAFFRNMTREDAARFSFLLSIPAVLLSGVYELFSQRATLLSGESAVLSIVIATVVSGVVGYWSIWFLLSFIKKHSMMLFVVYRVFFGILIIVLLSLGIIQN